MARGRYTEEQIDQVLETLAACDGNLKWAADRLFEAEFDPIPKWETMKRWRDEMYVERYQAIVVRSKEQIEDRTIDALRRTALRASEVEAGLLERLPNVSDDNLAQALRAAADVKSKSVDKLLAMTGRAPDRTPSMSMEQLLHGLAAKGLAQINVNLDVAMPRPQAELVEGTADEA
jgi:hypothetical protein